MILNPFRRVAKLNEGRNVEASNYNWIEIVPMLLILVIAIVALAIIPSCVDRGHCVEHVIRDKTVEKFAADLDSKTVLNKTMFLKP